MSHPDDVARLREIKRLLERIQRLPRLAGLPENGPRDSLLDDPADGPPGRLAEGHWGVSAGPQHPGSDLDLAPEPARDAAGMLPPDDDPLPRSFDPGHYDPSDADTERSDYWATDWTDRSGDGARALVAVRAKPETSGLSPWLFIAATAVNTMVAAVLAVVITLNVARRDTVPAEAEKLATVIKAAGAVRSDPVVPRPMELLPVGSAKEPLRLEAMKPTRVPFEVRPEEALEESYTLVLTGFPANATLSGAIRMGTNTWHLPPGSLQKLEIVVSEWSATVFEISVELRRTNGALAAQSKLWLAVPPPPTPKGVSLDEAGLKELVRTGDKHLSRGDVVAARAIYERAAAMGSAQAALAMGATFDQRRLWSLGVFGMIGNKDRARQWYQRADELGHPEAKARISALK